MAITSLVRSNPTGGLSVDGNAITGSEMWCLQTDIITSELGAITLLGALALNNIYGWLVPGISIHPENSGVRSTGFSVDREDDKTTQFSISTTLTNDVQEINRSKSGLDADAVIDYVEVDTIIEVDIDPLTGVAIAASNGEPYFPKVQRNGTDTRILINRNEVKYDPRQARQYRGRLNKISMQIEGREYPARTLLLESWTGIEAIDVNERDYFKVRYSFLYDPNEHKIELIDAASGVDLIGIWPIKRGAPNKPYKLGRDEGLDGKYMRKADQEDPNLFFTNEFNVHEEIDMRFLRL
ncbi:MAG TPA: hypothetical protein EYN51_06210 [Flavobacteriales bacterium]|nr:hypothetical protein [Flavobacteriales bacterium]